MDLRAVGGQVKRAGVYIFLFDPTPGGGGQKYDQIAGWGKN